MVAIPIGFVSIIDGNNTINGIVPEVKLQTILKGSLPFVGCMVVAILLLCLFPGIATWLPTAVMG